MVLLLGKFGLVIVQVCK